MQDPGATAFTIELLLERDSWVPNLGLQSGYQTTLSLLAGLRRKPGSEDGLPGETNGWNSAVRPRLVAACTELDCSVVQRLSSSMVLITLPAFPDYDITRPETIELLAPRDSVLSDQAIASQNVLVMRPSAGTAHLTGSLVDTTRMGLSLVPGTGAYETDIRPIREAELVAGGMLTERTLRSIVCAAAARTLDSSASTAQLAFAHPAVARRASTPQTT